MRQLLQALIVFTILKGITAQGCCWCVSTPQYIFLQSTNLDAFREFGRITANSYTTPRNQLNSRMQDWANQYNMTEELNNYQRRVDQINTDIENNVNTILDQIHNFMADYLSVRNDQTISQEEADRRMRSLFDAANRNLATVACCIINTVESARNTVPVTTYTYGPSISVGVYAGWFRHRRSYLQNQQNIVQKVLPNS
ncbi:unnamed protein product [Cylicocyclus nassatus]|uniref:SXP/RAL-2 family protein Ani s 5-like cation-binding domain-containing protein n=1 Tax=Cylicocyclus nassatus TaxID=53992 RepID=A0AA36MAP2_CYLNA|nr:unnamed protein product [Cylicocyclus nassatus]